MKPTLRFLVSFSLLFCTLYQSDVYANPEVVSITSSNACENSTENLLLPSLDYPCNPPDWQNTYNIGQTTATWSWDDCGANSYTVQWRYPGGSWYYLPVCHQTWINVINLNPCTAYEWRVRSNCHNGNYSSWCYPESFTTLCDYCETPYGCYTNNIHDTYADFHWANIWDADSYDVQIQMPNGSWSYLPNSPCYNNYITCYNLQPHTNYAWRVRARCGYNHYSDWTYYVYFTTTGYSYCPHPYGLQCYNITGYSATWKWDHVYDADYYTIQWCYEGGSWYDLPGGPFYGNWVNVNHLQPCTNYQYRVKSHCGYGSSSYWCQPYSFKSSCTGCPVPYNLITKDIEDYKATFKWNPVNGASSYSVQMRDYNGTWYDVPGSPTTGTWITVGNLHSCKGYEWRVRANCHYYEYSYWSNRVSFTTKCGYGCNPPEWGYASGINLTSANLHWAPTASADYYVVEWRLPGGSWYTLPGGPHTNSWAEITGLSPGTTYEWRVKIHCHTGLFSSYSPVRYFTTLSGTTCGMPLFRWTLPITDSTAKFNWTSVAGALNYTVQVRTINGPWVDVAGSPTADTSIIAKGLATNTQYEWRMQVNCSNGTYSLWLSPILFHTGIAPGCATPGSLYADSLTLTSAILNWAPVAGAQTYSVEIRLLPFGAWNPVVGSPVDTNFIKVNGLSPFTAYEWRVKAKCANGFHSFVSEAVQFTTTNLPTCSAPGILATRNITETTATLYWSPVAGISRYHVQTRLPGGTWIDHPGGLVADTAVVATGFTPNTTYEWRVRSECSPGQFSYWSATNTLTTIGTGPVNDDCSTAALLTVENSCVTSFASNVVSTSSSPAPIGGCWTNGYRDVWFKFAMPDVPNPVVTIRTTAGSLANAVMEVYTGPDCGVMSFIACEDNNDNGNGSSMPVINLTGTPSATIWVRVWGYDGSAGTFNICVFNFVSVNKSDLTEVYNIEDGMLLDELQDDVPVSEEIHVPADIQISPNPVSDELNVIVQQTESTRVAGLRILDLSGTQVITQKVDPVSDTEFKTRVDVSTLVPGIYVLQVQTTTGMIAEKISVVR